MYRPPLLQRVLHKLRRQRTAFLHVPKTGGTYVKQEETRWQERQPVLWPLEDLGHAWVVGVNDHATADYPPAGLDDGCVLRRNDLRKRFVVTSVRNPFDWLVSYACHAGGWTDGYRNPEHYDYTLANRSFGDLVRAMADRESPWPCRKLLFAQLFDSDGALVVDWVCRNESLDDDLAALAKRRGLVHHKRDKQRVGSARRRDYRTYYDDTLIDLVERTWGRELDLYGYAFTPGSMVRPLEGEPARLWRGATDKARQSVRYRWDRDELTRNGMLVSRHRRRDSDGAAQAA
ncbi:MAG: hypothetical protein AAF288_10070 [Planctomycetota bacterium]